jgi:cell wall-associated NlpC family hydrolase
MGSLMVVTRANSLIGKPRSEYQCNQVVNYALNNDKDSGLLASGYLTYGSKVENPQGGDVVVGKNGAHVGIFVSSTEFIHSSSSQGKVIKVGLSQLKHVFPEGYEIRRK